MLTFIREIPSRVACLCFVLVRFKIKDDCVWVCFVSFRWKFVTPPGRGLLVFPSFDQVITQVSDFLTARQSFQIGAFSCCFFAVFVNPNNFGSLFRIWDALDTTMPVATMKLKDSFGFRLIAINWDSFNESFTLVATSVMVNVFATLSRYMLEANKLL